mgnify:CR=1 FL=1
MKLKLGKGIGKIIFGMSPKDVISILGKPDLILTDEDDEDQNPVYEYSALNLRCTFYTHKNKLKLSYLRCSNPALTYKGAKLIGASIKSIKKDVFGEKIKWRSEHYFSFSNHFNKKYWMNIHEEYQKVTNVEVGVPYKKKGTKLNWPT